MTILIFSAVYLPYKTGYAANIHELAKRFVGNGHRVVVLTCNTHQKPKRELVDSVEVIRVPCWNPNWLNRSFPIPKPFGLVKICRELSANEINLAWTNTRFFPTTWLGFILAKINNWPIVHTERGSCHVSHSNVLIDFFGKVIDHTLGSVVMRFSDQVTAVSETACFFCEHLGAANPIKIYNGVDFDFWKRDLLMARSDKKKNRPIVMFAGKLIEAKGAQDLLMAVSEIDVELRIAGDGIFKKRLREMADRLDLVDRVIFLGELDREGVKRELSAADIFVNPSYSEGLPTCVLEAVSMELPVVATDVGGTAEIIPADYHVFLVKPKDVGDLARKITLLTNESATGKEMGREARRRALVNFDWRRIYRQYESLFQVRARN